MSARSVYSESVALPRMDVIYGRYEMPVCPFFVCAALLYTPGFDAVNTPASQNEELSRTNSSVSNFMRPHHYKRSWNPAEDSWHFLTPRQIRKRGPGKLASL